MCNKFTDVRATIFRAKRWKYWKLQMESNSIAKSLHKNWVWIYFVRCKSEYFVKVCYGYCFNTSVKLVMEYTYTEMSKWERTKLAKEENSNKGEKEEVAAKGIRIIIIIVKAAASKELILTHRLNFYYSTLKALKQTVGNFIFMFRFVDNSLFDGCS